MVNETLDDFVVMVNEILDDFVVLFCQGSTQGAAIDESCHNIFVLETLHMCHRHGGGYHDIIL